MSSRIRLLCVLAVVLLCNVPEVAVCGWPFTRAGDVLLGYGASYVRDGATATHRGIDIAGDPGTPIIAPARGRVSFAGLVPGDGTRVFAVTVVTADGLLVTCMPLESAAVSTDDAISEGAPLGMLAAGGDCSNSESHVHVSVRRGDAYLDPSGVLGPMLCAGDSADGVDAGQVPEAPAEMTAPALSEAVPVPAPSASADTGVGQVGVDVAVPPAEVAPLQADGVEASPARGPVGAREGESPGIGAVASEPRAAAAAGSSAGLIARRDGASFGQSIPNGPNAIAADPDRRRSRESRPRSVAVIATGFALLAGAGLWPLWRRGSRSPGSCGVRPTLDDVAAAVGR